MPSGAVLYCMLTGEPPHRTDQAVRQFDATPSLAERLARYRRLIENAPLPTGHRQVRGVDRALADVVDRCLAADPEQRYPNVQAVLDALADRATRRARRPMVILGAVLPSLLLLGVSWFAWQGFSTAVRESEDALAASALKSNLFAAEYVARTAASELELRYRAVGRLAEELAASKTFRQSLDGIAADPAATELAAEIYALQKQLSDGEARRGHQPRRRRPTRRPTPTAARRRGNGSVNSAAATASCPVGSPSNASSPSGSRPT